MSVEAFDAEESGDGFASIIDGNGESDPLGSGADCDVDTDDFAVEIEEGAAAVSRVDAGISLNEVLVGLNIIHFDIAMECADDAGGNGVFVSEGISDGVDCFSEHEVAGGTDGHNIEGFWSVDADDSEILSAVVRDDFGIEAATIVHGDGDQINILDNVEVRNDVATFVDDDSGSHTIHAACFG